MILAGVTALIILAVGYVWVLRGFFSSLINMLCVILAGAIAFAFFETLGEIIAEQGYGSIAYGLALAGIFAVCTAIFRVLIDGILRANVKCAPVVDYIGGGLCGAVSGLIIAGITVMSLGMCRVGDEFLGFRSVNTTAKGVVIESSLLVPADKFVSLLYRNASTGVFSTSQPLARWYPELEHIPSAMRASYSSGGARVTYSSKDFKIQGMYKIPGNATDLLSDTFFPTDKQLAATIDDQAISGPSSLVGVNVLFLASAKDAASGQVIVGNGQIRLVAQNGETWKSFFPVAVVAKAEVGGLAYGRFRFDAPKTFIASLGGDTEVPMAFEFLLPAGYEPRGIFVKGARASLPDTATDIPSVAQRDQMILAGALLSGQAAAKPLDESQAIQVRGSGDANQPIGGFRPNRLTRVLQDGTTTNGLTVIGGEGRNAGKVAGGSTILAIKNIPSSPSPELRVDGFEENNQVRIVMLDVSVDQEVSLVSPAVQTAMVENAANTQPFIVDSNGVRYAAVGFMYEDGENYQIRFEPASPLTKLDDAPILSRSNTRQKLILIFRPSRGVTITGFGVGDKLVAKYTPPYPVGE